LVSFRINWHLTEWTGVATRFVLGVRAGLFAERTAEVRVRSNVFRRENCGVQSGSGRRVSPSTYIFPCKGRCSMLQTHLSITKAT